MVITKSAASTTSSVRGLGNSIDYGDTDLAQYLHHQGVDRLAICYWSAVFGSRRVGSGVTGVPDFDQQGK
jgi:hypothetical protein